MSRSFTAKDIIDLTSPSQCPRPVAMAMGDDVIDLISPGPAVRAVARPSLFSMVTGESSTMNSPTKASTGPDLAAAASHGAVLEPLASDDSQASSSSLGLSLLAMLDLKTKEIEGNPLAPSSPVCRAVKHSNQGVLTPSAEAKAKRRKPAQVMDRQDAADIVDSGSGRVGEVVRPVVTAPAAVPVPAHLPAATATSSSNSSSSSTVRLKAPKAKASQQTLLPFQPLHPAPTPLPITATTVSAAAYEVVLLVDSRERCQETIITALTAERIPCEVSTLAVGDFLWIARPKAPSTLPSQTSSTSSASSATSAPSTGSSGWLVLDSIAERKTLTDLAASMIDGRYRDQKARLQLTGIAMCWYVVEMENNLLPPQLKCISLHAVKQAMISTYVDSEMHVLRTKGLEQTIRTLMQIHRYPFPASPAPS